MDMMEANQRSDDFEDVSTDEVPDERHQDRRDSRCSTPQASSYSPAGHRNDNDFLEESPHPRRDYTRIKGGRGRSLQRSRGVTSPSGF
ncbi:hypothetical protein BaRGS_00036412 [Batillaria attramentaria]|uniref:Uncharacterized protein n=1 Tax=Batillaria attramentaria TaxID=370345 RepID=A0ABD0JBU5_9CAEN